MSLEPAYKRQRLGDYGQEDEPPPPPPSAEHPDEKLGAALQRLQSHLSSARKFVKASALLRQLLAGGGLHRAAHGEAVFACLCAAMVAPSHSDDLALRREYQKLFTAASKAKALFSAPQLAHLDVFGLWAVLRPQLYTDDSFQYNRVLSTIKAAVAALPEATAEDDAIFQEMQVPTMKSSPLPDRSTAPSSSATESGTQQSAPSGPRESVPAGHSSPTAREAAADASRASTTHSTQPDKTDPPRMDGGNDAQNAHREALPQEDDPFGLQSVIQAQQAQQAEQAQQTQPNARRKVERTWTPEECLVMRRAALLDCFDTMRKSCSNTWAHLSTEIAIEELVKHRASFLPSQQARISELLHFAKAQRIRRQQGPSAKEKRQDTTTFEAARKTWSAATVSARGTIMEGNHRAEAWLG